MGIKKIGYIINIYLINAEEESVRYCKHEKEEWKHLNPKKSKMTKQRDIVLSFFYSLHAHVPNSMRGGVRDGLVI